MAKMLADGSNPEGVDPDPPLAWASKEDFKDVTLYGDPNSPAVITIKAFLIAKNIAFDYNKKAKPKTPYKKVPVIDVAGRQVNDSGIILKYMVPALGEEFNAEWGENINKVLDTTFRYNLSKPDAVKMAGALLPLPKCCFQCCVANQIRKMLRKAMEQRLAWTGMGYKVGDKGWL